MDGPRTDAVIQSTHFIDPETTYPDSFSHAPTYSLLVVELDDVVPRRDPMKPNLYVSVTTMSPTSRYVSLLTGNGPAWLRQQIRSLRDDLSIYGTTSDHQEATDLRKNLISQLRSQGYTVNRNTDVWTVYVVELDPAATPNPGRGYVYVGETKKSPEQRLNEHLQRARNGRSRLYSEVVAKHGIRLRMDLAPNTTLYDRASSRIAESDWAHHLCSLGYTVRGGH